MRSALKNGQCNKSIKIKSKFSTYLTCIQAILTYMTIQIFELTIYYLNLTFKICFASGDKLE